MTSPVLVYARWDSSGRLAATDIRQSTNNALIASQIIAQPNNVMRVPPRNMNEDEQTVFLRQRNIGGCDGKASCAIREIGFLLFPRRLICAGEIGNGNSSVPSENAGQGANLLHQRCSAGGRWRRKCPRLELHKAKRDTDPAIPSHYPGRCIALGRQAGRRLRGGRVQRRAIEDAGSARSLIHPQNLRGRKARVLCNLLKVFPLGRALLVLPAVDRDRSNTQVASKGFLSDAVVCPPFRQRVVIFSHTPLLNQNGRTRKRFLAA